MTQPETRTPAQIAAELLAHAAQKRIDADELEANTDPAVPRPCPRPEAYRALAASLEARAAALVSA